MAVTPFAVSGFCALSLKKYLGRELARTKMGDADDLFCDL
jgi:hypothetical protein